MFQNSSWICPGDSSEANSGTDLKLALKTSLIGYRVLSRRFDKNELRIPKEKRTAISPEVGRIGEKIRNTRKTLGWTQGDLAKKTGFSQQTISFIEGGYINVSFLTLKNITASLGLSISIS